MDLAADHGRRLTSLALLAVLLLLAAVAAPATGAAETPRQFKECKLQYFVQLQGGVPGSPAHFLPPLNGTFSGNFGAGVLFALNVTKTVSRTSQLLGTVRGYTIDANYVIGAPSRNVEVALVEYDDGTFAGTLQIQGLVLGGPTEVAVVGGTGSFRGARGYISINLVNMTPPSFMTFSHDVVLL